MTVRAVQLFPSDKQKNPYTKKIDKIPTDYNGTALCHGREMHEMIWLDASSTRCTWLT